MSPRALDPSVPAALTHAAMEILAGEGRGALSARRLAREAKTSTTAVYTYFGSMDDVHRQVRKYAIGELLSEFDSEPVTDDPVTDLARVAAIHVRHGCAHPAMYRVMFVDQPPDTVDDPGAEVFARFTELIERCIEEGRFQPDEPHHPHMWAGELWAMAHGVVVSALAGLFSSEHAMVLHQDMLFRHCVGLGDDRARARRSVESVAI
ncbi:TetR/AcrR family transcriptional regulator [Williamsia sterculiae]|uniref:Transcriptional regulator, TetR family n=1 Tax=Williamsia sterculiae TaxID=1344003 RepID=A0A1N7HAR3_9NOCA|nr:TetR/AcrR family transcriptional regulator [Williamsia sterculiae]SIS21748.1 transcriptional regulator, TetR family [Williamsia sterculiae]